VLRPLQEIFAAKDYPDLLVGLETPDDAAVWRLDDERDLVVTTDFFTPVVDDAYTYGAVAAANALSDLYAMGATPFLALNIAAMPVNLESEIVGEIFRGGAEKVKEAGAVVAGGHTIQDDEPKFGLVAVGMCKHDQLMTKGGARPGDVLVLTKPIGTGVITTALRQERAEAEHLQEAVDWMMRLNATASRLAIDANVKAATDVTGFSLLGHGMELADASGVGLRIHMGSIPFITGARSYVEQGFYPTGSANNLAHFGPRVNFDDSIDRYDRMLLFDAQTSGGLLLAVTESELEKFLSEATAQKQAAWPIGVVEKGSGIRVVDGAFTAADHREE
jgi:selenide,water dikinase